MYMQKRVRSDSPVCLTHSQQESKKIEEEVIEQRMSMGKTGAEQPLVSRYPKTRDVSEGNSKRQRWRKEDGWMVGKTRERKQSIPHSRFFFSVYVLHSAAVAVRLMPGAVFRIPEQPIPTRVVHLY
jgi:hypothetical protein